jgi:hypothetical protein
MKTHTILRNLLVLSLFGTATWMVWTKDNQQEQIDNSTARGSYSAPKIQHFFDEIQMLRRSLASIKKNLDQKADAIQAQSKMERIRNDLHTLRSELIDSENDQIADKGYDFVQEETKQTDLSQIKASHENAFYQQSTDTAWSQEETDILRGYFSSEPVNGLSLSQLECRAATCRMELNLDTKDAQENFLNIVGLPPFDKGGFHYITEDKLRLIVFTGRV